MATITDFDSVEVQTFSPIPQTATMIEAVVKGVGALHLRGTTDAEYLRQHFTFVVPKDNTGAALHTPAYPYATQAIAIAYPATVELDGLGTLGWGIDSVTAKTQHVRQPDGTYVTETIVDVYAVVRSKNVAFMRMGFLVMIIHPGYANL